MRIKKLSQADKCEAVRLVWKVFSEFEAPEYDEAGIETFRDFLNDESIIKSLDMYGAFDEKQLVGVIAMRSSGSHISLFFVEKSHHRQGIGRSLFETVLKNSRASEITVNASPYATEIYHKLGFADTDAEKVASGIRYTPMKYKR